MNVTVTTYPAWLPLVRAAEATWPDKDWPYWHVYQTEHSVKFATKDAYRLTAPCQILLNHMLTHVTANIPEFQSAKVFPDLDLHGAGMHWIPKDGFLAPHVDSEKHPVRQWFRVASSVLFLSECEGGELCVEGLDPIAPNPGKLVTLPSNRKHWVRPVLAGNRYTLSVFWWALEGHGSTTSATFEDFS